MLQFGDKLDKVQERPPESEPPVLTLPDGAGLTGDHQLVVQVLINFWGGKTTGVAATDKFYRLEVVRWCKLDDYNEDADAWMRVRLGKKSQDTTMRPDMRVSLILRKAPSYGLSNVRPWLAAVTELEKAIQWAQNECRIHKTNQYALLLAVHTSKTTLIKPRNEKYEAYLESDITAIVQAEVIKLAPKQDDLPIIDACRIGGEEPEDGEDDELNSYKNW